MSNLDSIRRLLDRYVAIVHSPRNVECRRLWRHSRSIILDKWRGCPAPVAEIGRAPVAVWLGTDILQPVLGLDMVRYYCEPLYFLEKWLTVKLFHFDHFADDNYYDAFIPIWLGEGFEATLFGMPMRYAADKDPSIDRARPVVSPESPAASLPAPDFRSAGLMPLAIRFYEEIRRVIEPFGLGAGFVNWGNGPQMTCNYLCGFEEMSLAYALDAEFARDLLLRVAAERNRWTRERAAYLGTAIAPGEILDDDLSVPNVSPRVYGEFIFPAEKAIADFHGGIAYWHDCGPADPYLPKVRDLGEIQLMHVGPFSDPETVARLFGRTAALEHHVKPLEEGTQATPEFLAARFRQIRDLYRRYNVRAYTVRLTAYHHPRQGFDRDIANAQAWVKLAGETFVY